MRSRSLQGIKKLFILTTAVSLVLLYTVYSYNNLEGKSYIHEPIYINVAGSIPKHAKLALQYKTVNDPSKTQIASRVIHDSIPENTFVFEIDSSYRVVDISIYFQLLKKNDEVVLYQIKATNRRHNEYIFSLKTRDLIATDNLSIMPLENNFVKLRKTTERDPQGAALYFSTRGSLGGIFIRSGLRLMEIPTPLAILVIMAMGILTAFSIIPIISRVDWRGISPGAYLLAVTILILPTGEKVCNLLLAIAVLSGIIRGIQHGELLMRFRKNLQILLPLMVITIIYLLALLLSDAHPEAMNLLKIKFGLPMTLLTVALNINCKKELQIQLVALITGVIISIFIHMGWTIMFIETMEAKSKFFSFPRYYLESTVFSRVHHSYLSIVYLMGLVTLYYQRVSLSLRKSEILILTLLILIGLVFAFSRAAILALSLILIYFAIRRAFGLLHLDIGNLARITAAFALVLTLLFIVFGDLGSWTFHTKIKGMETRVGIWQVASDIIKQRPIFGWGLGGYKDELNLGNQSGIFNINTWSKLNTHNQFLETSGMFGLVATLLLVCFLIFPTGYRNQNPSHKHFIIFVAIIFITGFFFESVLNRNLGILVFGISYGLLIKMKPTHDN